ncbi:MAG: N-acetyl-gamma-glutamyl-phosphate reductase [Fimbriimonadaceae bacterium]|nr:N-acetyl-gamma-glutamyl-phosphate reductase [Fimbriimonadaceae bacterium]
MNRVRVAIVGATGYTGAELVRILARHPGAELVAVTSERLDGQPLATGAAWLPSELTLQKYDPRAISADVVFLAQESGFAREAAPEWAGRSVIIDLSADFRLVDDATRQSAYGHGPLPDVGPIAYGLPELVPHAEIAQAALIANPGCHVTAAALATVPFQRAGHLLETPVIVSQTGVSGAGRAKRDPAYTFSELAEATSAYGVVGHRHVPELEQVLGRAVRFTPVLVPMTRGMLSVCQFRCDTPDALVPTLRDAYADSPFVRLVESPPSTKQVRGTNRADLYATFDARTGHAVVLCAIDNLGKGAAGQAVQNFNLRFGFPEATGLPMEAVWP